MWARWGDIAPGFPFDDPEAVVFTVFVDGAVRGLVQYTEELTPMYRHAGIDLFLDPVIHGAGVGREVVWLVADHLVRERQHHRLIIDPAPTTRRRSGRTAPWVSVRAASCGSTSRSGRELA